jgi:nucleoside-diphosphate-sugar epimerase
MREHETILLTGITGSVGAWLAGEALRRGHRIAALMRGGDLPVARRRVGAVLETVGLPELADQVEVVLGDIEQEGFGINGQRAALRTARRLIHCAGCTEFDAAPALLQRINVEGTRHALQLAEELDLAVVHVSTAYVAGRCTGLAREDDLDLRREFNNPYEQSKANGEALVADWRRRTGQEVTILRPSIVLGDSTNGHKVGFNALYPVMRAFDLIADHVRGRELRVMVNPEATKNFIPVDYFAQTAWRLIESGQGGVYHVTNPEPMAFTRLRDIFAELFGLYGLRLVDEQDFGRQPATDLEDLIRAATESYLSYAMSEPQFDRRNTDAALADEAPGAPVLDLPFFDRLLQFARARHWREPRAA